MERFPPNAGTVCSIYDHSVILAYTSHLTFGINIPEAGTVGITQFIPFLVWVLWQCAYDSFKEQVTVVQEREPDGISQSQSLKRTRKNIPTIQKQMTYLAKAWKAVSVLSIFGRSLNRPMSAYE